MNNSTRSTLIVLLSVLTARAVTFNTDTLIDFANTNYDGADVVVTNCTVTINGPHAFASLHVLNGGKLKHQASDSGLFYTSVSTNEALVLTSTNAVPLTLTNVVGPSVAVSNSDGTIFYTNGADYILITSPLTTWIQRTDTSSIPDGATVSVSYTTMVLLGPSGLNLAIAGDLLLEPGASIEVTGLGYDHGYGPGHGGTVGYPPTGGGGGYGGYGGFSSSNAPGGFSYSYYSLAGLQPVGKGSEGGALGGAGGGAVQLNVGGLLRVDGSILANGMVATNERAGGGSGGSIWLTAQTFTGSGAIMANGGDGEPPNGGGGAGGRIGIYYQTNNFVGPLAACGGRGFQSGGAGTIYTQSGQSAGAALVDNGGRSGALTLLTSTQTYALTVTSGAVLSNGWPQTVSSLLVASNGWVLMMKWGLTVLGDATIQRDSGVTADANGYPAQFGPGAGKYGSRGYIAGGGAGYGGGGANVGTNLLSGGGGYGSVTQPIDMGSGGGNGGGTYPYNLGGAGGGAILLTVNGSLNLDGRITANGGRGIGQGSGGGSGGSISLNVGGFYGSGMVSACGGLGNDIGGGGGGGRIAIYCQNSSFNGTVVATGAGSGTNVAGAGTIYTKAASQSAGQLLIDNGGQLATVASSFTGQQSTALTVQGGAIAAPLGSQTFSSLVINNNGWLMLTNAPQTVTGDAIINSGGGIISDGLGYGGMTGPGAGRVLSFVIPGGPTVYYGSGAGYGGYGGFGIVGYGSSTQPTDMGSGGGSGGGVNYGAGAGGGAVRLTVSGTLRIDGAVSADGAPASSLNAGGGSGGTIALTVGTLAGSGSISVDGGAGNALGGGGGGGRISITYNSSYFEGTMHAYGGSGTAVGSAGTIYTRATTQNTGQLLVDNGGTLGANTAATLSGSVDVILRGGAVVSNFLATPPYLNNLMIASNSWVVFGYGAGSGTTFSIGGNLTVQPGGGIRADGAGSGPGAGQGAGRTVFVNNTYVGSGGGYGGYGGPVPSGSTFGAGGNAYGPALNTPLAGSGGGGDAAAGGAGGGALNLRVTGVCLLDGLISANGTAARPGSLGGGGSGGSVYLTANALMGIGAISASGGNGDGLGGGGGGGRIFLLPAINSFSGTAVAYGGNGAVRGGAGTVYTAVGQNIGQIVADNGGLPGTNTFLQDSSLFDLAIRGAARLSFYNNPFIRNLTIASNSWIALSGSQLYSVSITVWSNAVLDAGGGILADARGYPAEDGPGRGQNYVLGITNVGGGGAHGGYGGAGWSVLGGNAYDLALNPTMPGSGGGDAALLGGGSGGGAVSVRVTGSLVLNGKISADGGAALGHNGGGGAGGSIYVTAGALLGSGTLSANGGAGASLGGGGGGGRIAILPAINLFSGTISATGGNGYVPGGAGTIYANAPGSVGQIAVDNGGLSGTNTLISDSGTFDLLIQDGAHAFLTTDSARPRNLYVGADAWLLLPTNPITINISGNAVIDSSGRVMADGLGYGPGAGPGAGGYYNNIRGGAGYGGYGGANPSGGGNAYGSVQTPTQVGSGGASGVTPYFGGKGGGAVMLNVTGILDIEGSISANGLPGSQNAGGGSGGGIWLTAGTLLGSGSISANGGDGVGFGGGGGGGRIALICGTNLFNGTTTAYGGNGYAGGGAGTIYLARRTPATGSAQIIVDNGGRSGTNTSLNYIGSSVDLIIGNGGIATAINGLSFRNLLLLSNGWITASGGYSPVGAQISAYGDATIQAGAGIIADSAGSRGGAGVGAGCTVTSPLGTAGSGGGYGGAGASSATGANGGTTYDSITSPSLGGSGGGAGLNNSSGGLGGGVVTFNVTGTLQLDGRISANGGPGLPPGGGGGSGGAVSLSVGRLAGSGLISANGGTGDGLGGGGGGGRIRLGFGSKSFAGSVTAYGGGGSAWGGAGTVYSFQTTQPAAGLVLVDNGGHLGTNTPFSSPTTLDLAIQNGGIVSVATNYQRWSNLVVSAAGTLTCPGGTSNLDLMVFRNARIDSGGAIAVDGRGFTQGTGPGAGLTSNYVGSGAGYGGLGGASSLSPGGPTYGSAQQPSDWGSGGGLGWAVAGSSGSEGGGALRLSVGGILTVNGSLSANGDAGIQDDAGGGSGGSVWIETSTLTGNGSISANGGPGQLFDGGGGGGGRIAVYSRNNTFAGQLAALGGFGYYPGQDGSVYTSSTFISPAVLAQDPVGLVTNGVQLLDLFFNKPLSPYSLDASDFTLLTPPGSLPPQPIYVYLPGAAHVQLLFAPLQTAVGNYSLLVGPNIQDLFGQPMSQVYTGSFSVLLPVIQGTVTNLAGQPVAGVVLQPDTGFSPAITDTNGNYSLGVVPGTTFTVTPQLDNLVFVPGYRSYTNFAGSIANANYLVVSSLAPQLLTQTSPTNLTLGWFGIPGVTYQPLISSNLVDWLPYGPALMGTNGAVELVVPNDGTPQNFFKLRASN